MIGNVHCQRSTSALDGSPENMRGYGLTSRSSPVRRSSRVEERAVVAAGVEDVGIPGIGRDVAGLRAAGAVECRRRATAAAASAAATAAAAPAAEVRVARHADRAPVLLRAADVIRDVARRDGVVILRRRDVLRAPRRRGRRPLTLRLAGREGHRPAAVVAEHEVLGIVRIDPQIVMVAVRSRRASSSSCRRRWIDTG